MRFPVLAVRRRTTRLVAMTLVGFAVAAAIPGSAQGAVMTTMYARPADQLAQLPGMNTKLLYGQTPYADFARTNALLQALGVRHIRDQWTPVRPDYDRELRSLAAMGIHSDLIVSARNANPSVIAGSINALVAKAPQSVEAVEAPNEWNLNGGPNWVDELRTYQRVLYQTVRSHPQLANVTVLAPSLGRREGFDQLGNLSPYTDAGNIHLYPGGHLPSDGVDAELADARDVVGAQPTRVTESGFHDNLQTDSTHPPTSDAGAAIYLPRLWLEYFRRGVPRVYDYELYDQNENNAKGDQEGHFGLIRADGTKKPIFGAFQNMLALVNDRGPGFAVEQLPLSIDSGGQPVVRQLVQRRDGQFVLFLYRDVSVWDFHARRDVAVPAVPATIRFARSFSQIQEYRPTYGGAPVRTVIRNATTSTSTVTVPLQGDVVALVLTP